MAVLITAIITQHCHYYSSLSLWSNAQSLLQTCEQGNKAVLAVHPVFIVPLKSDSTCETNPYICDFQAGSLALKPSICAELFSKVRVSFSCWASGCVLPSRYT
jgi:hypothetical protein